SAYSCDPHRAAVIVTSAAVPVPVGTKRSEVKIKSTVPNILLDRFISLLNLQSYSRNGFGVVTITSSTGLSTCVVNPLGVTFQFLLSTSKIADLDVESGYMSCVS